MNNHEEIVDTNVSDELSNSFLEYSMSVIVSRALPDVRDGLKPVHRRILWSMYTQGMRPERGYNKCARATGDIMGKYHPHGDAAIYDALVRMAQPWSMRVVLIDGHGNFGSLDDGPAAARYTECRLSNESMSLVSEIEEDTVDMRANYDGREKEPSVLPATFPNLLVNGSQGIAVGMATNMPPHNLKESIEATKFLINNPESKLEQIMKILPGPDFPTGGLILNYEGVKEAYKTGRGSFKIRAKASIEDGKGKKKQIVISELPYNVGPEKVIQRIKELVTNKKILGISDIKNFSDRKVGLRLVVEIKNGFTAEAVLDDLYRMSPLEESFSVSNVALVNNQPRTLPLLDILKEYIKHRVDVVRRRTEYRKKKAENRAHILEGLIIAQANIDEVIKIVKKSKDTQDAKLNLIKKFSIDEVQAESILQMTISRLTSLEVSKLKDELKELKLTIKELKKILGDKKVLNELIISELDKISENFFTERRSKIVKKSEDELNEELLSDVSNEDAVVILDNKFQVRKYLKGEDISEKSNSQIIDYITINNREDLLIISNLGRSHRIPVRNLTNKSLKLNEYLNLITGEKPIGLVSTSNDIFLFTKNGICKRISGEELPKNTFQIIKLKGNDLVIGCKNLLGELDKTNVIVVSNDAQLLAFKASEVSSQKANSSGIIGMKIKEGSEVIYFTLVKSKDKDQFLTTISDQGSVKISKVIDYPIKGRGTSGVRCMMMKKNEKNITLAVIDERVLLIGDKGVYQPDKKYEKRDAGGKFYKEKIIGLGRELSK